jgi:uncharacterized protein involved in exopolysaccharide biosynthesis
MERQKNSEIEIIKSNVLIDKVIQALGSEGIYPELSKITEPEIEKTRDDSTKSKDLFSFLSMPKFLELFDWANVSSKKEKDLKINNQKNSNVITVSFDHPDPIIAANVVKTLIDLYMERHLEVHTRNKAFNFFKKQSELLEKTLKQSERKLEAFKKEHQLASPEEERKHLLQQKTALQTELNRTLVSELETKKRISQLKDQLDNTEEMVRLDQAVSENNPLVISQLEDRLIELELEEKRLRRTYTDEAPFKQKMLQEVREEIATVSKKLKEQEAKKKQTTRSGKNKVYLNLEQMYLQNEVDQSAIRTKKQTQREQLGNYQNQLKNLSKLDVQYKRLTQAVDQNRRNYIEYLTKFEKLRISRAMDSDRMSNVYVIEPAQVPAQPENSNLFLNIALAAVAGLLGGLGLMVFREYTDDTFDKVEDTENWLEIPVLASVGKLEMAPNRSERNS